MKLFNMTIALFMLVYMSMFVGVVAADPGAGVCVLGNGFSVGTSAAPGFTGVNVGDPTTENSVDGVSEDQAEYEKQCCAETGQEPDCFEPVQ